LYIGSRLPPNSMTFDDFERWNKSFYGFFGNFRLGDTFQEQIVPKPIEIDMDKPRKKFSALNVDFINPSLVFVDSRKPAHKGIKQRYPRKNHYFTVLGQSFVKAVVISMGMLPITTSTSDEIFSRTNINDFERPWTSKIRGFIDFCDLRLQRTLQEWTAMKWLEIDCQFANRNCYRLLRISWALAKIFCVYGSFATKNAQQIKPIKQDFIFSECL